jgi:hypothetical protein
MRESGNAETDTRREMALLLATQILDLNDKSGATRDEMRAALGAAAALMPVYVNAPPPGTTVMYT